MFIRFPLAISTSKVVFSLEGSTLGKGANLVDTKLLSAPESNKILALCWFIKNVLVTTLEALDSVVDQLSSQVLIYRLKDLRAKDRARDQIVEILMDMVMSLQRRLDGAPRGP